MASNFLGADSSEEAQGASRACGDCDLHSSAEVRHVAPEPLLEGALLQRRPGDIRRAQIEVVCKSLPFLVLLGSGCVTLLPRPADCALHPSPSHAEPLTVSSTWTL